MTNQEQTNYTEQMLNGVSDAEAMANIEADREWQQTWDNLWESGREYALTGILSDIEYPSDMDEDDIEEFEDTYEIIDVNPDVDAMTCEVIISSGDDEGLWISALGTVDKDMCIRWEITSVEYQ